MATRQFIFTCFTQFTTIILLSVCLGYSTFAQTVQARVKLEVIDGDLEGTNISIWANGKQVDAFEPKRKRIKLDLNFQKEYTVKFEKNGYLGKEIHIDTRNVPLHMRDELLDFAFVLELIPSLGLPVTTEDTLQMAVWSYDKDYGVFDYERTDNSFTSILNRTKLEYIDSSN